MSIRADIETLLSASGIACYWLIAPHDAATPFVVHQQININPIRTHEGYAADRARWQLACWAYTADEAEELADTVRGLFDLNRTNFELSTREAELDLPDPDTNLYRRILDFNIWKKG